MSVRRDALSQIDDVVPIPDSRPRLVRTQTLAGFAVAVSGLALAALISGSADVAQATIEPWGMAGFTAVGHGLPAMLVFAGLMLLLGFTGKAFLFLPVPGLLAVAFGYPTTLGLGPFAYPRDGDHTLPALVAVVVAVAAAGVTAWSLRPVDAAFRWKPGPGATAAGSSGRGRNSLPPGYNVHAIMAFAFSVGLSIFGVAFGHMALRELRTSGEQGRNLAIVGLVIGCTALAAQVLLVVVLTMHLFIP